MIFTGASALFTLVLTIIIIYQTYSLHKKQQKLEKKQLKVNVYKYRHEVYRNLITVFDYCYNLKMHDEWESFRDLSVKDLKQINELVISRTNGFSSSVEDVINGAKHLFNKDIAEEINYVNNRFGIIVTTFNILQDDSSDIPEGFNDNCIRLIVHSIYEVDSKKDELINLLDEELDISNLE